MIFRNLLLGTVAVVVGTFGPAPSGAEAYLASFTIDKCLAGKLKIVGKATAAYAGCHAKNTANPEPESFGACLTKASGKLTSAFGKLDGKYPSCTGGLGNAAARDADVAAYATAANGDVGNMPGKCDVAKQKCLGKYVAAIMSCYAKAASKTGLVDNASPKGCTTKTRSKLADGAKGCLDKAAAQGDCSNAGSQEAPVGAAADAFIEEQACLLDPSAGGCPPPIPTPTATATPTNTPTATPTSTATSTASLTPTATGPTPTPTPGGCPSTIEFAPDAGNPLSSFDWGWTGIGHDLPLVTGGTLTVAVTGASGSDCLFAGPVTNPPGTMANRRCTGNTATPCTSNADCTIAGGTCEFFWGAPDPVSAVGVSFCFTNQIAGSVSGSVDLATGAVTRSLVTKQRVYNGISISQPCPKCVGDGAINDGVQGGTCSGGARNGLACDTQGVSPIPTFGATSLDCPPSSGGLLGTSSVDLSGSTGTESLTLSAASPSCKASGLSAFRCGCQTCNNVNAEPCETDADCPISGGNPGVCGGLRCLAGANAGAPCTATSHCPGSSCALPGEATKPSACVDDTLTPGLQIDCVDTLPAGDHHGTCAFGPVDNHCAPPEQYVYCNTPSDCPLTATCLYELRSCYLDDGMIGNGITSEGIADPPIGGIASPTITSVFCYPPVTAGAVNSGAGLPGPARLTVGETMKLNP